ncbi:complex I NDUFA9 subunit family protein [Flexistipes sp.]|uniref:complex I NDUFA9 subunit family protein n=1 Tax=Flexistipes sp. TaxID=3088135 RepID=UPI002E1D3A7B|nr:complex I NDUFA9 subunit family protein [Flexistipes sp.]
MKDTVFLTGATGFVGSEVQKRLLEKNYRIKVLVRDKDRLKENSADIVPVEGDVLNPESFRKEMEDVDTVIHLVGIIREFPSQGITFEKLHFEATKNVVDTAVSNGIKRFIHMSANGARENAVTDYHKTKYKAEEYVRNSGLTYTIFRPSLIYGPGDSFVNMLADMIKKLPVFSYFGKGDYKMQPVSVYEVAEIFAESIPISTMYGKTYSVCGDKVYTYRELLNVIMDVIGKKRLLISVPEAFVSTGIAVFGGFSWFPITKDQFIMLKEGNVCTDDEAFEETNVKKRNMKELLKTYLT